jgi:hypothetical protein
MLDCTNGTQVITSRKLDEEGVKSKPNKSQGWLNSRVMKRHKQTIADRRQAGSS